MYIIKIISNPNSGTFVPPETFFRNPLWLGWKPRFTVTFGHSILHPLAWRNRFTLPNQGCQFASNFRFLVHQAVICNDRYAEISSINFMELLPKQWQLKSKQTSREIETRNTLLNKKYNKLCTALLLFVTENFLKYFDFSVNKITA